jgi:hypothetical protein
MVKSVRRLDCAAIALAAALVTAQGSAIALTVRRLGPADEAEHLIRRPTDERVAHESLAGTATRTASERRRSNYLMKSAHPVRRATDERMAHRSLAGTVTLTATERRPRNQPMKSARQARTLGELRPLGGWFTTVTRPR